MHILSVTCTFHNIGLQKREKKISRWEESGDISSTTVVREIHVKNRSTYAVQLLVQCGDTNMRSGK